MSHVDYLIQIHKISKIFKKLDDFETHVVYMLYEINFHHNKVMWQKPMQRDHNHSHHVEYEELKLYL